MSDICKIEWYVKIEESLILIFKGIICVIKAKTIILYIISWRKALILLENCVNSRKLQKELPSFKLNTCENVFKTIKKL